MILKEGKERSVESRHPWLFSGAVHSLPSFTDGEVLEVRSFKGAVLGYAYFNRASSIVGRFLSFGSADWKTTLKNNFANACAFRRRLFSEDDTNAWRAINGEGDNIPGLIVDRYSDIAVLQIHTRGIEELKSFFLEEITTHLSPRGIFERSQVGARKEEGLPMFEGVLFGEVPTEVIVKENGNQFIVSFEHSQKTGFFLDQREMRKLVGELSRGRSLLNCFSFTGGFSVYGARGGASHVVSVDSSADAIALCSRSMELNNVSSSFHEECVADVFEFLPKRAKDFDLIVLDPPAFAKRREHVARAAKGYYEINRLALEKMRTPGILVTCSCSHFVDNELFQKILFRASRDAGRDVRIVHKHRQASDHPVNIFHPEGEYLKSLVLEIL